MLREYARLERKRSGAGLTPQELLRWTELKRGLARRFSPDLSDVQCDQRNSLRIPTRLKVSFRSRDAFRQSLMTNLNRGGVFVSTGAPAAIGTPITLRIRIEETGDVLEVRTEVVSQNVGPSYSSTTLGMGMRFLDMPPDVQKKLDDLYEKALNDQVRATEEIADRASEKDAGNG